MESISKCAVALPFRVKHHTLTSWALHSKQNMFTFAVKQQLHQSITLTDSGFVHQISTGSISFPLFPHLPLTFSVFSFDSLVVGILVNQDLYSPSCMHSAAEVGVGSGLLRLLLTYNNMDYE